MAVNKPSHLSSKLWAKIGNLEQPDDVKMDSGWAAEIPKSQIENWVQNRQDRAIGHYNERGIAEWDASTDYLAGKSYVQGSNGNIYKSVQNTGPTTVVQNPTTDVSGTYWTIAFSPFVHTHSIANIVGLQAALDAKQATLVSGTNIKTLNGNSLLGAGDIALALGEVNTASNVGSGVGVYKEKAGVDLSFKSLIAGAGIAITPGTDTITIENTGGGGGNTTASNVGNGEGVFKEKVGDDLKFKSFIAGTGVVLVSQDDTIQINSLEGTGILVFPTEAEVPLPSNVPTPTIAYLEASRELAYSTDIDWKVFSVSRTFTGGGIDPLFGNVSLLLHFNSSPFLDSSSLSNTVNMSGGVSLDTTDYKFGGASAYFDGVNGLVSIPDSVNLQFGSGDFTIEGWIHPLNAADSRCIFIHRAAMQSTGIYILLTNGNLVANFGDAASASYEVTLTSPGTVPVNQWTHIAVSRNGNTFRLFLNGTQVGTANSSVTLADSGNIRFGLREDGQHQFSGHMDDFRLTKGVARYVTNFAVPHYQYPDN